MLNYQNSELRVSESAAEAGTIRWKSPSNLALIKYWGKYARQYPRNPSISFTLNHACTDTQLQYQSKGKAGTEIDLEFFFEGQKNEAFRQKLLLFLESIVPIFPFLQQFRLRIHSTNSFPHSAGIASSASSMSALALCLCSMERQLFGTLTDDAAFRQKASYVARLGSGSACRSVYPIMAIWGTNAVVAEASNDFAVPYASSIHDVFRSYHDDILIASRGEKSVSSRAGHALMEDNIYAASRYQQANQRFNDLLDALQKGDLEQFGRITENEALTLHALMMTSEPSYLLMRPNSLAMIERVRAYREDTGHALYFSLDAGPNLHLLYPDEIKTPVKSFIQSELLPFCEQGEWIEDQVGAGPKLVF
ncbi:MAG: diphosphomevalonate decarboxylase [Bacteroidota bacterium]